MNINFRVTARQDTILKQAAKKNRISTSEYVRQRLFSTESIIGSYGTIMEYLDENQKSFKMLLNLIVHSIAEQHGSDTAREIVNRVKKIVEEDEKYEK